MEIKINIEKRHLYLFAGVIGILIGVFIGVAYNDPPYPGSQNPATFGHSVDEMDWSKQIQSSISIRDNVIVGGNVGIGTTTPAYKLIRFAHSSN